MTLKGLLTFFESFYGEKYSGVFLDTMAAYLAGYSESFYTAAAKVIVKRFSRAFNRSPGPAEIEANIREIMAEMPKLYSLPDRAPEISDEERAENIRLLDELKKSFTKRKSGPMADMILETLNNIGDDIVY